MDKSLLAEKEQRRRRFTLAHEEAHYILSRIYAVPEIPTDFLCDKKPSDLLRTVLGPAPRLFGKGLLCFGKNGSARLPEGELFERYPDEIKPYIPFVLPSWSKAR